MELAYGRHIGRIVCRSERIVADHTLDRIFIQGNCSRYATGVYCLESHGLQIGQRGQNPPRSHQSPKGFVYCTFVIGQVTDHLQFLGRTQAVLMH